MLFNYILKVQKKFFMSGRSTSTACSECVLMVFLFTYLHSSTSIANKLID